MNDHTAPLPDGITFAQFHEALAAGKLRIKLIKDRHPELKGYLALGSQNEQTEADNDLPRMIEEFPDLFHDSVIKTRAKNHVCNLRIAEKSYENAKLGQRSKISEVIKVLKEGIQDISRNLVVNGNCRIEIRFRHLDYALIWKLQSDEGVDRDLTPQTRASIRIVLGTLSRFAHVQP